MALIDKNTLKDWFSRGKKPLASQFANWIDSYWHKAEKIPMSEVENLTATLNTKAEKLSLTAEINARVEGDTNLQNQIDGLQKTDEKAQPNGYAPLDADNKVPAEHLPDLDNQEVYVHSEIPLNIDWSMGLNQYLEASLLGSVEIGLINISDNSAVLTLFIKNTGAGSIVFKTGDITYPVIGKVDGIGDYAVSMKTMSVNDENILRINIAKYE